MTTKKATNVQVITVDLDNGTSLVFEVKRQDYINFVNGSVKNTFNAMQNLLANSVTEQSEEVLQDLIANPANVTEIAGEVIQDYKPDVAATVKKRKR
jgi:hypothetical protein